MNAKKQTATQHLFTNKQLRTLLVPIMVEQLLSSLMGTADTMMVSNVGSAAISAVSLVDAINILVIQALSALAAGGAILCSQYLGSQNLKKAKRSAEQVLFVMLVLSCSLSLLCLIFRFPLLRLIFGTVDTDVMANSQIYFFFTLLSFPFIGLYDAGASILRAQNNTKGPMTISILSNFLNIGGNAILIFVFGMGVAGAAISTLVSRIFCAIVVIWQLRNPAEQIYVRNYFSIRPDWSLIKRVLFIGIPSGIENSMFQFGKLAIQSTVSTLGTVAIAAQAMTSILEALNGIAAMGVGIGLMTVVGQCIGAKRKDDERAAAQRWAGSLSARNERCTCASPPAALPSQALTRQLSQRESLWHFAKLNLFARGSPTRGNNDDRRQWRKQGVVVGAAASKTQAKRCGCWVPQPGLGGRKPD